MTETAIKLGFPLLLLFGTYLVGSAVEKSHYREIRSRELRSGRFPTVNFRTPPQSWQRTSSPAATHSRLRR